jgi:hypothetical protein
MSRNRELALFFQQNQKMKMPLTRNRVILKNVLFSCNRAFVYFFKYLDQTIIIGNMPKFSKRVAMRISPRNNTKFLLTCTIRKMHRIITCFNRTFA